jgi:hypothetical protein
LAWGSVVSLAITTIIDSRAFSLNCIELSPILLAIIPYQEINRKAEAEVLLPPSGAILCDPLVIPNWDGSDYERG